MFAFQTLATYFNSSAFVDSGSQKYALEKVVLKGNPEGAMTTHRGRNDGLPRGRPSSLALTHRLTHFFASTVKTSGSSSSRVFRRFPQLAS